LPKYRIVKVSSFRHKGKRYFPGDIVELPKRFATLDFTEPVLEKKQEPVVEKKKAPEATKPKK